MKLEEGQLVKFSYMSVDTSDDSLLGLVTKISEGKVEILWMVGESTYSVSYKDFQHAIDNGVYELVEEKG